MVIFPAKKVKHSWGDQQRPRKQHVQRLRETWKRRSQRGSSCEPTCLTHRNCLAYKPKPLGPGILSCDMLELCEDPYKLFLLWKTCDLSFLFSFYIGTNRYIFILTDPRVYKASESWVRPVVECLCYGCTPKFMVALFTITKICKQPKSPSTDSEYRRSGMYMEWNITEP